MSEETKTETPEVKTEAPKQGRPAKQPKIKNNSGRPITLMVTNTNKETILPTQTKEVSKEFLAEIKKNKAAMTFFDSGELVEV